MPAWLHRTSKQVLLSIASADLPEAIANYIEDPDMSGVFGIPPKYWIITGDFVSEMSLAQKAVVDAALDAALVTDNREINLAEPDSEQSEGMRVRALIQLLNKRDNYLVNRIIELQDALLAMKATSGGAQTIRDTIPVNFMASQVRSRADAVQDYRDDINAGVND